MLMQPNELVGCLTIAPDQPINKLAISEFLGFQEGIGDVRQISHVHIP